MNAPAPRRAVLLDANMLLLLYVGTFDPDLVDKFKRTRQYSVDDFELLRAIVAPFDVIATTPHVLAEVSNLSGHLPNHLRYHYFALLVKSIVLLDETHAPAEALVGEAIFIRLGLTDAGVARLARAAALTVVTADLDLYLHLISIGVRAINFNTVSKLGQLVEELSP